MPIGEFQKPQITVYTETCCEYRGVLGSEGKIRGFYTKKKFIITKVTKLNV